MNYNDWKLILILSEEKNITKTANRLYLSQPGVTKRIQFLETELGVKIVERTSRGILFTEEGKEFVKYCQKMTEEKDLFFKKIQQFKEKADHSLHIGAPNNFVKLNLPRFLSELKKDSFKINFDLKTGWSKDVFLMMKNNTIDIGFLKGEYPWDGEKLFLFKDKYCLISSEEINLHNIKDKKIIKYNTDSLASETITRWWNENTPTNKDFLVVDRSDTCKEMVKQGIGCAIVPETTINEQDNLYSITLNHLDGTPLERSVYAIFNKDFYKSKKGEVFIKYLKQTIWK